MSEKDNDNNKDIKNGVNKTLIGLAGVIIGVAGAAAWNNREKIKESTLTAKDRAMELKEKTNKMIDSIKEKVIESKLQDFNEHEKSIEEKTIYLLSIAEKALEENILKSESPEEDN